MKNESRSAGYTLIETLAVVAIMGIMSAVVMANYNFNKKNIVLNQAAQKIMMDLRRVQNMAMNTTKFNGAIPSGGYGINISVSSPGTYIIYADTGGDKIYSGSAEKFPSGVSPDIAFDSNIEISSVDANNIDFVPPEPKVWINGVDGSSSLLPAAITLRYIGTTLTKTINVNSITGQITGN